MLELTEDYKNFVIKFSKEYPMIEFHFTALNVFADNLPEVMTTINCSINGQKLSEIEIEYDDMLEKEIGRYVDYSVYSTSCFVLEEDFDTNWYKNDSPYFRIKDGNFTKLNKVSI